MKSVVLPGVLIVLLSGCDIKKPGHVQYLPEHDQASTQSYITTCGQCHAIPHPSRHTAGEWKHILVSMDKRMQERKYPLPAQKVRLEIQSYLEKYARN